MSDSPEPSPAPSEGAAQKKTDPVAGFKKMQTAEKMLAIAAAVTLIAFIIQGKWSFLFAYIWFPTCAFLGSILVIVLVALELFGVKLFDAKTRIYILILCAILPALGFVVDALRDFWSGVMLAGAIVMGYAAAKITTREKIITRD